MEVDVRNSDQYREAEALHKALRKPASGHISDCMELNASPDGNFAVFTGVMVDSLEGAPPSRICQVDLRSGEIKVITFGPNTDRLPRYSPNRRLIAFLSDRHRFGDFQLYLLDATTGVVQATTVVDGWVEYLEWSPDGNRVLLGVAGRGADVSGGQGAITSTGVSENVPDWMPEVQIGDEDYRWRRVWVYDIHACVARQVSQANTNVWEATWCGEDSVAAVVSPGPSEGLWYSARLHLIDVKTGRSRGIYMPQNQIGWPAASPSGRRLAIVDAICSDRWYVAGDLRLIDTDNLMSQRVDTRGVDITYTEWRSDRHLLLAGHRGFETVIGLLDAHTSTFTELWASQDITTGGRYVTVSGVGESGDCILAGESFGRAPEIAAIRCGRYETLRSCDSGYADCAQLIDTVDRVRWTASDGLEVQGLLLRPSGEDAHPLIMNVHGGPVWHWRQTWLGRWGVPTLMLLRRGYAIFLPNPRGSSGRGQEFVQRVRGDLGGADARDLLSGLDALVERGVADPLRLGVTGTSYGGFMSSWLITQDPRFAASVPVAPHTNQVTEHLLSNIPHFLELFLGDRFDKPDGKYFQRSPVMHTRRTNTPTLNICGALDRCTPPEEAAQFHNALLESGVRSVLVTYPNEGHGIRKWPASIDYAARLVMWFEEHMPARQ